MSGVEVVGILFATLGLIDPLSKGLKSVSGITKSSASFQKYLKETSLQCHCYGQMFKNESRRIFGNLLSEAEIEQMFGEKGNTDLRWQDDQWKEDVRKHLGSFYEEVSSAMLLVFQTLSQIHKTLDKLALEDFASIIESANKVQNDYKQDLLPVKEKSKIERRKGKIKEGFQDVNRYVLLYKEAVNHFLEDQKWRLNATKALLAPSQRRSRARGRPKATPWVSVAPVIDSLHEATQRLSLALQNAASCPCHAYHLRLEMSMNHSRLDNGPTLSGFGPNDPRYSRLNFNILSVGCANAGILQRNGGIDIDVGVCGQRSLQLSYLRVELKPINTPRKLAFASPVPSLNSQTSTVSDSGPSNVEACKKSKLKKTVAFARESITSALLTAGSGKRKDCPAPPNPRIPISSLLQSTDPPTDLNPTTVLTQIDDLCTLIQKLGSSSSSKDTDCLGYICAGKDVQYLVYPEISATRSVEDEGQQRCESLLVLISSGRLSLSIPQRLELSHTLAISLLRLHSSSWIQRNWSSKDIMLLLSADSFESKEQWSPYVAAAFNDIGKIQEIMRAENTESSKSKLSYVISLGIILLEIGLSRNLGPETEANDSNSSRDMETWLKACKLVALAEVNKHMGPRFQNVVETCVKWHGKHELEDEEVQRRFYEDVVLELEICIQKLNASAERRRRKRESASPSVSGSP